MRERGSERFRDWGFKRSCGVILRRTFANWIICRSWVDIRRSVSQLVELVMFHWVVTLSQVCYVRSLEEPAIVHLEFDLSGTKTLLSNRRAAGQQNPFNYNYHSSAEWLKKAGKAHPPILLLILPFPLPLSPHPPNQSLTYSPARTPAALLASSPPPSPPPNAPEPAVPRGTAPPEPCPFD